MDDVKLFNYEHTTPNFPIQIISNAVLPTVGSLTAAVSGVGTVSGLSIVSGGANYTSAPSVSISSPSVGVGLTKSRWFSRVATTATATVTVSGGAIDGFAITNPGLGYTIAPSVLVQPPQRA